jgi:hypothetical protein
MKQTIDPVKLRLAAVRLRWVLLQYPESGDVRMYIPYEDPSVDEAYTSFRNELKGGLTEQDRRILARMAAIQASINGTDDHG